MKKKSVLISPLNWGLGHATRCIPLIKAFEEKGWEVIIGAEKQGYTLLKAEFPGRKIIHLPGVEIKYSRNLPFVIKIIFQLPKILIQIYQEHLRLQKIIDSYSIDLVISDNRYGLFSDKIPAIFMTHQLHVKPPNYLKAFSKMLFKINLRFIKRFDRLWIPDFETPPTLAGELAHPPLKDFTDYIGPLSRFNYAEADREFDFCLVLSGPEPQRTLFEKRALSSIPGHIKGIVIRGLPGTSTTPDLKENIRIYNHLPSDEFQNYLLKSGVIICRSGYSSVMDLIALKKPAVFVPTPGQTEQEYLAWHLAGKSFAWMTQKDFSLAEALDQGARLTKPEYPSAADLRQKITESLHKLDGSISRG